MKHDNGRNGENLADDDESQGRESALAYRNEGFTKNPFDLKKIAREQMLLVDDGAVSSQLVFSPPNTEMVDDFHNDRQQDTRHSRFPAS